jgi:hypothetical protein
MLPPPAMKKSVITMMAIDLLIVFCPTSALRVLARSAKYFSKALLATYLSVQCFLPEMRHEVTCDATNDIVGNGQADDDPAEGQAGGSCPSEITAQDWRWRYKPSLDIVQTPK